MFCLKVHDLYREKGNSTILAMLFEYLEKVAAIPAYAEQTQALDHSFRRNWPQR